MADEIRTTLGELSDSERLRVYDMLVSACTHLYSKGKLQRDRFDAVAATFASLARTDPLFMAHFTAWAAKGQSKDQMVLSVFFNSLNDADGQPFFEGSTLCKPNFRTVSQALLQGMDPKQAGRVLELCRMRFGIPGHLNNAQHFTTGMKTAFGKYLAYREQNPDMLRGIRRAGLTERMRYLYRFAQVSPTDEAAAILGWKQDGADIELMKLPDFKGMDSDDIAATIIEQRMSPMIVVAMLPTDKVTASVAKALLHTCSGNQAIVLYRWFSTNGFLDVPAIRDLFIDQIEKATTAVDRIETLTADAVQEDKEAMAQVRSKVRKKATRASEIGKIFLHIDASGSMDHVIEYAKDRAAVIAECVDNPEENFRWGVFGCGGRELPLPQEFTKEHFHAALYGIRADMGATDCIELYPLARQFGADVDVYLTDQGHNVGTINLRIEQFHAEHPEYSRPRASVIVDFLTGMMYQKYLSPQLERAGMPFAIIKPEALTESALVAEAVRNAIRGQMATIDEIMGTPLPTLPKWWNEVKKATPRRRPAKNKRVTVGA